MRTPSLLVSLAALAAAAAAPTQAMAAQGCNSLWAQEYAIEHGITKCQDPTQTVACDKNNDGDNTDAGDTCTVNELLNEHHADPLRGELVDDPTDVDSDGIFVEFAADIVPGGSDGNMSARAVPLCADGSASCPGEELRCVDGTRPVYYVDPADDLTSTKWLIAFQGGGGCGKSDTMTGGESCWDKYQDGSERPEMSTTVLKGANVLGLKRSLNGSGILDDRIANNFNDYHRIKVHKCSFDRGAGQIMRTHLTGANRAVDPDTGDGKPAAVIDPATGEVGKFNLTFHGWFIVQAILEDLKTGPVVDVFETGGTADLPPMSDATTVLLAGHSGGSVGLVQKVDAMEEIIVDDWGTSADVFALLDARGKPSVDNEAFLTDSGASGDNFYDYASGAVACDAATEDCLPASASSPETDYSDDVYITGRLHNLADYRSDILDASCEAAHAATGDAWRCLNQDHVMYHHVAVPFFLRQSQRDSNHLNKAPDWSDDTSYAWDPSEYQTRVVDQVLAFEAERNKAWANRDWEERLYGWAQPGNQGIGFFFPDTTKHAGLFNNAHFFSTYLDDGTDCASYHDALSDWISGGDQVWIEGEYGVTSAPSCP